jgi:hypothetical protein
VASLLRLWLDPIISPQFATVATMLLVAIFVLANTVSADGSISGVYHASLQLAEQTSGSSNGELNEITNDLKELVGTEEKKPATPQKENVDEQKEFTKPAPKPSIQGQNNR